jgi:hypothetical protein
LEVSSIKTFTDLTLESAGEISPAALECKRSFNQREDQRNEGQLSARSGYS